MDFLLCKYMNIDDDLDHLEWLWSAMGQEGRLVPEYLNSETRCQILCSMRLQCVSKILTPCRMLKKSLLVAKINRWNNSFQNM